MISYKTLLEARKSTVVMAFGRLNPPTMGHELLVNAVASIAKKHNADHVIFVSRTQDSKKNPLSVDQKVSYARHSFKEMNIVGATDKIRTFIEAAKSLTGKYDNLIMIAGSDRVLEYKQLLDKYNGKDFNFKSILVVSAGERDPDEEGAAGMSASKMRAAAAANDFAKFKQGVPSKMSPAMARRMFDDVRAGMDLTEETDEVRELYIKDELFNVGDIVVYEGKELPVVVRGSNYVVLEGNIRAWLHDIKPTNKVHEAMQIKQQDKLKAARIIGMSLGYMDAETKNDPAQIINYALRGIRNKPMNAETKAILSRMLELAKSMEIPYDEKLVNLKEDFATADYVIDKAGRKYRKVIRTGAHEKENEVEEAMEVVIPEPLTPEEQEEADKELEKHHHNLMYNPLMKQTEYKRVRKIHLRAHESEEKDGPLDDDFDEDDFLLNISDDEIVEHGYDDDEFQVVDDENGEVKESFELKPLSEVLSRVERMRAKIKMRRSEAKRERAEKIALKRRSSGAVLAKRARRVAVKTLEKRLARKPLNTLSVGEKERLEARIARMGPVITRLAAKMIPRVRKVEKERLEHKSTKD